MPLAPWNIPPNFLGAIQAGAGAGLAARRADLEEQSSGDRLQLAYNQLAEEERQRNEAAQARMQMATAANALRASQIDMLSRYHQGQLQNQQAGEAQRAQIAQQVLAQKTAQANRPTTHFGTQGEVLQEDPTTGAISVVRPREYQPPKISTFDSQSHAALAKQESDLVAQLSGNDLPTAQADAARNKLRNLRWAMTQISGKYAKPPGPATTGTATSAAATPFAEGQVVRNKKDGKLYKITGGVPVPVDENANPGE